MKKYILLILLFFNFNNIIQAQSISEYFKAIKKEKSISVNQEWFAEKNQKSTFKKLRIYLDSDVREQRYSAYSLSAKVGLISEKSSLRSDAVQRLVNGLDDGDKGVRKMIYSKLKKFDRTDFNYRSQEKIQQLLLSEDKTDKDLILIAGWIANDNIYQILSEKNKQSADKDKLFYHLALSRTGDAAATDYIVRIFKDKTLTDRVLYAIGKDLLYTKQTDIYNLFVSAIFSDEKNCSSGNPNVSEKISCSYQIMVLLAPYIEDYPIKVDKWGDALIEDNKYNEALLATRKWLSENDGMFEFTEGY